MARLGRSFPARALYLRTPMAAVVIPPPSLLVFTQKVTLSDPSDLAVYTVPSTTPTANTLQLLVLSARDVGTAVPPDPVVTGCNLTWVQVVTDGTTQTRRVWLYRAMGSAPTAGTLSISFSHNMRTLNAELWEVSGTDLSGSNGAGAIVQSAGVLDSGSPASLTVPLAAFADPANNAAFCAFRRVWITGWSITLEGGYTAGADLKQETEELISGFQYGQDLAVVGTMGGANGACSGIAVEIKVAATGTKIAVLQTTFAGSSLPSPFVDGSSGGSESVAGGQLILSSGDAGGEYGSIDTSATTYDLDESAIYWSWTPTVGSYLWVGLFNAGFTQGYRVIADRTANTLIVQRIAGGVATGIFSATFDTLNHQWGRIRETVGGIHFEFAPQNGGQPGTFVDLFTESTTTNGSFNDTAVIPRIRNEYVATANNLATLDSINAALQPRFRRWDGSAWVAPGTLKYWNGAAWIAKPLKVWS